MKKKNALSYILIFVLIAAFLLSAASCANADGADTTGPASPSTIEPETLETVDPDVSFQTITETDTETETEADTTTAAPPDTEPVTQYTEPVTEAPYTEPVTTPPETTTAATEPVTQPVLPPVADGALAGCLFIGDSRTDGLRLTGALPGADIFCSVGLSVFGATSEVVDVGGVSVNLGQLLSSRSYSKIFILLGINEIGYNLDTVASKFSELISFVQGYQPGAKIIVEANLHVTTSRSAQGDVFNNNNINTLNQKLQALTNGSTICWLDANQLLDDGSGGLNESYSGGDGIHLNWDCYVMWGQWIASQSAYY